MPLKNIRVAKHLHPSSSSSSSAASTILEPSSNNPHLRHQLIPLLGKRSLASVQATKSAKTTSSRKIRNNSNQRATSVRVSNRLTVDMSEQYFDEYEHFNYDYDKHIFNGHSGKQRTKKEALMHTNHFDPSGHSRKILTKIVNTEHNRRQKVKS